MNEKIEKREKILIAAKAEFAKKGYSGARMGAISKLAGVNQALLHYYFENKEKLYLELLHHLFGINKIAFFEEVFEQWEMTPPEALYSSIYLLVHIHFGASDPDFNRIIAREITEGRDAIKYIMKDYFVPKINSIERIIINGTKQGYFETKNPCFVVLQIIFFLLSFQSNQEIYSETDLYSKLCGKNTAEELFQFLIEHTFRALTPGSRKVDIPVIPEEIISAIDRIIENVKNEFERHDDLIRE